MVHMLQLKNWYIITTWSLYFIQISLHFTECPFSVIGSNIIFNLHISLECTWLWQFLTLSLFLMTLTVLKNTDQVFYNMSLYWDLSDVFLMIRLGLWVLGRKTTEVKCHFHHILSRAHTTNRTYHCGCYLGHLAEVVFVRFLYCKVIP